MAGADSRCLCGPDMVVAMKDRFDMFDAIEFIAKFLILIMGLIIFWPAVVIYAAVLLPEVIFCFIRDKVRETP